MENVITTSENSIQRLTSDVLTESGEMDLKVLHGATEDSGYGAARRYRGWKLVQNCRLHVLIALYPVVLGKAVTQKWKLTTAKSM